ncbi:hypothetical protein H2201_007156 [Coniosporium apollinis]|uniref:Protein YOP1 n=2 Tax=Coniosporium TaxID=2810619 RepID=A0ABQ9NN78_9PEZI|nr:hypothetical protein H2199_000345 [Cladosporium sp. JES 115]KAJ9659897.1 hypothetical protein H2201_007156 [Coniosporium apollinis]
MFDILPNLLTTLLTILLPIYASYKALRTSDPAQLTPWLMYWVIVSLINTVESTFWIITWFPFYAYLRLALGLYLVAPGKQGATFLYTTYVHPFFEDHEREIDEWISEAHDKAKAAGLQYMKQAIEWVKVNVLGMQPKPPSPPPSRHVSYTQALLSRFNLPSAREGLAAPAGDFYALLSAALQTTTASGGSRDVQAESLSTSGTLIPPHLDSAEDRMSYVAAQRERLRVLLQAFDHEADNLAAGRSREAPEERRTEGMSKSRSELDFDKIERDEAAEGRRGSRPASGGWMPWNWGARAVPSAPYPTRPEDRQSSGRSTGLEY